MKNLPEIWKVNNYIDQETNPFGKQLFSIFALSEKKEGSELSADNLLKIIFNNESQCDSDILRNTHQMWDTLQALRINQ